MEPDRPLIQIDDLVRPMTDDEYAAYQEQQKDLPPPLEGTAP
jgi:hypothetical protein